MLAVDISNYTDHLTPGAIEGLKDAGVEHAIVQAVDPPPGFPAGLTREQVELCWAGGLTVDAYLFLWFDADVDNVERNLRLLDGLEIRQIWLDVEDIACSRYDQATTEAKVAAALTVCDHFPSLSRTRTGIYTGLWFWADPRYMANTTRFCDRDLWDANYDNVADAGVGFKPYGGWQHVAIKQFQGTSVLAGISGLDLNALSVDVATEISKLRAKRQQSTSSRIR